jgi:hypothetical protein
MKKLLLILLCLPMIGMGQSPTERLFNLAMDAMEEKNHELFMQRISKIHDIEVDSEKYYFTTTDDRTIYHASPVTLYFFGVAQFGLELFRDAVQTTDFIIDYEISFDNHQLSASVFNLNANSKILLARSDSDKDPETWRSICRSLDLACKLEHTNACQTYNSMEICDLIYRERK